MFEERVSLEHPVIVLTLHFDHNGDVRRSLAEGLDESDPVEYTRELRGHLWRGLQIHGLAGFL